MLETLGNYASSISCIIALIVMFVKPIREKVFGEKKREEEIREGQRCLLRSEIVRIYYRHLEDKTLHQYEYENLCLCYKAYKQLGGNSFIDHIYNEMQEWTIIQ
jgi:hypothetical protein